MTSHRLLHISARLPWHAGEGDQQSFPRGHPGAGVSRHSRLIMVRCSPAVSKLGELEYCRRPWHDGRLGCLGSAVVVGAFSIAFIAVPSRP